MSKIWIVKPNVIPCEYVTKFHAEPCYLVRDMSEVDIDEVYKDFRMLCIKKCGGIIGDCKNCEINHKSFGEYLQERMK